MSLESLFKARKTNGILVPLLNEHLLLEGKKPSGRSTGVFHPSEVTGFFCPRQWVIKERHRDELEKDEILPGLFRVFEIGHRLHEMMQDFFSDMGLMYGYHVCKKCREKYLGFQPEKCECGWKKFEYQEVKISDPDYHIDGHTDGIIVIGDLDSPFRQPKKYIFEFKTINIQGFTALRKPIEAHREQASLYMKCLDKMRHKKLKEMEEAGMQDTDVYKVESLPFEGVIIVYLNKGQQPPDGKGDLKEYLVTYDEASDLIAPKYPKLEETWKHYIGGTYPERVCGSRTEGHKCKCPKQIIDYCFGTLQD